MLKNLIDPYAHAPMLEQPIDIQEEKEAPSSVSGGIWMYRVHPVTLSSSTTFSIKLNFGVPRLITSEPLPLVRSVFLSTGYKSLIVT
jgi:hypothetical protein